MNNIMNLLINNIKLNNKNEYNNLHIFNLNVNINNSSDNTALYKKKL